MQTKPRFSLRSTVAVLALTGATAFAQPTPQAPQTPPAATAMPTAQPPMGAKPMPKGPGARSRDDAATAAVINGRVERWLVNPNGEVDGLLLADGTQVGFSPRLSADAQSALKVGDNVEVSGRRAANAPVIRASSLKATGSGRIVAIQPPVPGEAKPAPRAPRDPGALTAINASGRVARILYTGRGDANGVLLDSGTIVRFPPHVGAAYASTLQPGSTLQARGWGTRNANGTSIEATAMGGSTETMRELFAGPGVNPPPPPKAGPDKGPRAPKPPAPMAAQPAPAS